LRLQRGGEHYTATWFIFRRTEGNSIYFGLGSVYNVITDPSAPPGHPVLDGIAAPCFRPIIIFHSKIKQKLFREVYIIGYKEGDQLVIKQQLSASEKGNGVVLFTRSIQ
jgi:hypothetical protein